MLPVRLADSLVALHVPHNAKLIVGVSGGSDSTALLCALAALPKPWNLSLHVCHVNYGLRGKDSSQDSEFISALSDRLNAAVSIHAAEDSPTDEAGLRDIRRAFFQQELQKVGAHAILLGHTYEDQVETILLRLIRGTGLKGLSAMRARSSNILRPFLHIHKKSLVQYLKYIRQDWREDSTNAETEYLRNKVRHDLLPLLQSYNPNIPERLTAIAEAANADYAYIRAQAEAMLSLLQKSSSPHAVSLDYAGWRALPRALQHEVLRCAIRRVAGELASITLVHLEEASEMLTNRRTEGQKLFFGRLRIQEEYDIISITFLQ